MTGNAKTRRRAKRKAARAAALRPMAPEEFMELVWKSATATPVSSVAVLVPDDSTDPEGAALAVLAPFASVPR